jgi:hypothetical protein
MKANYVRLPRSLTPTGLDDPVVRISESGYQKLKQQLVEEALREGAVQGIAAVLAGMSKHGYGKKRLQDALAWAQEVLSMPEVFSRTLTADDVLDYLKSSYDLKVDELKMNVQSEFVDEVTDRVDDSKIGGIRK